MFKFFAVLSRMKYIDRWVLMRNVRKENICEHSHQTAVLAHALAIIANERFGEHIDADKCAVIALYHDASEIVTGDLPTPIKHNTYIEESYAKMEDNAKRILLDRLPEEMRPGYRELLYAESTFPEEWRYVKAADVLSAYIKCIEEMNAGNKEFSVAKKSIYKKLEKNDLPALKYFMDEFLPAFSETVDEQS
ncbi:MAG: 5'-deoxynucleotidase [Eubacteriales bacterium]